MCLPQVNLGKAEPSDQSVFIEHGDRKFRRYARVVVARSKDKYKIYKIYKALDWLDICTDLSSRN